METLIYIDDRPCSRFRPCSFNYFLFNYNNINLVLIRFNDVHYNDEYLKYTKNILSYVVDSSLSIKENSNNFKKWCKNKSIIPMHFICMSEPKQEFGQEFARFLNLDSLDKDTTYALRHKPTMKKWINSCNIKTAKFSIVNNVIDIIHFLKKNSYPIIIKPTNGWGTLNTFKITNEEELNSFFKNNQVKEIMVEEFIPYREYECCALVQKGKVLDTFLSYMPESPLNASKGAINANISYGYLKDNFPVDLKPTIQKIVNKYKIKNGYIHSEFFLNPKTKDITISEIAFRYPGCEIAKNHGLALGFNMAEITLKIYLKQKINIIYSNDKCVGDLLLPYYHGEVIEVTSKDSLLEMEGVIECVFEVYRGEILPKLEDSSFNCSGWVIVEGNSIKEVEERMRNILNNFTLKTI